jgi:hypothetical protein
MMYPDGYDKIFLKYYYSTVEKFTREDLGIMLTFNLITKPEYEELLKLCPPLTAD